MKINYILFCSNLRICIGRWCEGKDLSETFLNMEVKTYNIIIQRDFME